MTTKAKSEPGQKSEAASGKQSAAAVRERGVRERGVRAGAAGRSTGGKGSASPATSSRPVEKAKRVAPRKEASAPQGAPRSSRPHMPKDDAPPSVKRAARALSPSAPKEKERVAAILAGLDRLYPDATCELDFQTPFQLLVATILSAQCTDKMVNSVTPALFARYPDAAALAAAEPADVEPLVAKTGFFRNKAKNIVAASRLLAREHGGEVPRDMDALLTLPGVARKTANVVLGTAYGIPSGFVVDTHIGRLARRLGLSTEEDPVKVERDLTARIPQERWVLTGHQLIWHGRRVCQARRPECAACELAAYCPSAFRDEA